MAWFLLACAILTEIAATTALKYTNGLNIFTHTFLTIMVVVLYITSYVCMAQALKLQLEVSIAYALWSGIGTAAIAVIGAIFFRESVHPVKIGGIALIIVGVAMLNLVPDATHGTAASDQTGAVRPATNVALAQALTGLTVTVGRHRAFIGSAYRTGPVRPDGDGYGRHGRHARTAWGGHATARTAGLGDPATTGVTGRHLLRPRVLALPAPPPDDHALPVRNVPDHPEPTPVGRHRALAPAAHGHDLHGLVVGAGYETAHLAEAAALPAPAPVYSPPAARAADPVPHRRTGAASGHDDEVVVEPAAVQPPAAPLAALPPRRRDPIKGVTLLHPYPDRPAVRTRSA
jgi:small multidrug resistance pump